MVLVKTKGIVLKSFPYGDSSLIVKVFTRQFGLLSFLAQGVKKSKSKNSGSVFLPSQIVELVFYKKDDNQLQKIKEINILHQSQQKFIEPLKIALVMFVSEVALKSIHEDVKDETLFDYLEACSKEIEDTQYVSQFPLKFLAGLFVHLGIQPKENYSMEFSFFNMEEGVFQMDHGQNQHLLRAPYSEYFYQIIYDEKFLLSGSLNYEDRILMLNHLLRYLHIHALHSKQINSAEMLHEIL